MNAKGEFTGSLNRPVLLWSDGSTITMEVTLLMMNLYTNFFVIEGSSQCVEVQSEGAVV